jgi:UDP-GlcNAc:undecaprenyl-phosphate GlcNAc-1-phosphate transferase
MPLYDAVCTILRRLLRGDMPFRPHRDHFHHLLMARGMSMERTVGTIIGMAAVMAAVGVAAYRLGVPEWWLFYGFLGLFALYCLAVVRAWKGVTV